MLSYNVGLLLILSAAFENWFLQLTYRLKTDQKLVCSVLSPIYRLSHSGRTSASNSSFPKPKLTFGKKKAGSEYNIHLPR